jgi:hypothetical protein
VLAQRAESRGLTAPALFMPCEFPRISFAGKNRVLEKGLFSAFVYNRVAYSLIFPVLSVSLAVLALWLPLPLPWLDPRLP